MGGPDSYPIGWTHFFPMQSIKIKHNALFKLFAFASIPHRAGTYLFRRCFCFFHPEPDRENTAFGSTEPKEAAPQVLVKTSGKTFLIGSLIKVFVCYTFKYRMIPHDRIANGRWLEVDGVKFGFG
jgi:hypothetical protein